MAHDAVIAAMQQDGTLASSASFAYRCLALNMEGTRTREDFEHANVQKTIVARSFARNFEITLSDLHALPAVPPRKFNMEDT